MVGNFHWPVDTFLFCLSPLTFVFQLRLAMPHALFGEPSLLVHYFCSFARRSLCFLLPVEGLCALWRLFDWAS